MHRSRRPAFTLVEVLIVIVVIGILVTVLVTAIGSALSNARIAATKATITKVHGLVQERVRAIDQAVQSPGFDDRAAQAQRRWRTATAGQGRIIAMKEEMQRIFYGVRPGPGNTTVMNYPPQTPAQGGDPRLESSKRLYAGLTSGAVHGVPPVDTDTFNSNEIKIDETDQQRRPYFVDAWGEPLRFYLFPTRLVRPAGAGTGPNRDLVGLNIEGLTVDLMRGDPQDPLGEFASWATAYYAQQNPMPPNRAGTPGIEHDFHTLGSYHNPLIVSSGPDHDLGLYEPFDVNSAAAPPVFGHLAQPLPGVETNPFESAVSDNVTSHQRAGRN